MQPSLSENRGGARWRPGHLLWVLTPALYPALHWGGMGLPSVLRALLALLLLVPLPGWLLHDLILPRPGVGPAARIARAFLLGVALLSLWGLAAWFCGGDLHLGPVAAAGSEAASWCGRLSAVVAAQALFLLLGAGFLNVRGIARRRRAGRAGRGEASASGAPGVPPGEATEGAVPGQGDLTVGPAAASPAPGASGGTVGGGVGGTDPWERIVRQAHRLSAEQKRARALAPRWVTLFVLAVIIAAAAALAFYAGANFGLFTDVPAHLATLREMIEQDQVLPRTNFYRDGDGTTVDPRVGFFHVALAAVALLGGVAPLRLLTVLPGILAPFALLIFHTLARRILRSEGTALLATFLALLCFGQVYRGLLAHLAYGSQMGIVLSWVVLALALHYVHGDRRRSMGVLIALGAFAATATHAFAAVALLFSLGVFLVALLLVHGPRGRSIRRAARALLAVLLGCLPVLAWRLAFAGGSANPIHTHDQGLLYLGERLFIVDPGQWASAWGAIGWAGILLSFFLWKRLREGEGVVFMVALSLAPLLIVLNPVLVPLLHDQIGYLVARFATLVPYVIVIAYVARWMGESLLELTSTRRVVTALLFYGLMVGALFPRLEGFARSYGSANLERARSRSILIWEDLLARLDAEGDEPAVVLSDPLTGYAIPALTRHYTVSVLHQHGSPADSLALERLAACRDVLSPYLGTMEKARLCRRFAVDYVLLNEAFERPWQLFGCSVGPALAQRQRAALDADAALFRRVWEMPERGVLYAVRAENLDALAGIVTAGDPMPPRRTTEALTREILLRYLPAEAIPVLPDTVAGITLTAVAFDTTRVVRGESLGVTLYWRRVGPPARFPTTTHVRLDTEAPRGPFWTRAWSKPHRIWMQLRRKRFYRLRESGPPLAGVLGIEHWPRDRYVVDHLAVKVPLRAQPGEYIVRAKWELASFLPNLPLRHYLSDQDAYQGMAIGAVEID